MRRPVVIAVVGLAVLAAIAAFAWPELARWWSLREAGSSLLERPVYAVLRAHEPETFGRITRRYADVRRGDASEAEFINFANAELAEAATRRLANASDAAVVGLVRDMVATAKTLSDAPGDACFRFWFPTISGPPDVAAHVDAAAQARTLEAVAEVIRSAAESPVALPEGDAVADKLAAVVNATFEEFGADAQMIAHAEDPRVDRGKVCTMTTALYERILAWPPSDAAAIIRAMTQFG